MKNKFIGMMMGAVLVSSSLGLQVAAAQNVNGPFSDVTLYTTSAEAIAFMKAEGIVQGYPDGTYRADNTINRAEFLKIVVEARDGFEKKQGEDCVAKRKATGATTVYLSDVAVDSWYAPYVCYGIEQKIIAGYPDGTFQPSKNINVAEMAKIVTMTQNLSLDPNTTSDWYTPYVKTLEKKSAIPMEMKEISSDVTRANMAEVVFRLVAKRDDRPSQTLADLKGIPKPLPVNGELGAITSCGNLGEVMYSQVETNSYNYRYGMGMPVTMAPSKDAMEPASPTSGMVSEDASLSSDGFSETNVQVAGVDEADIVKTDGQYIYILSSSALKIVDTASGGVMKEVASVSLETKNGFQPTEMYMTDNKVVVMGTSYRYEDGGVSPTPAPYLKYFSGHIMPPYYWGTTYTEVKIINITQKTTPVLERSVAVEGYLNNSRRIGDTLYFVMQHTPEYNILTEPGHRTEELLPVLTDSVSGNVKKPLVNCGDVQYFPGYERPDYLIISSLSLSDAVKPVQSEVILGSVDTIYMSPTHLFVATGYVEKGEYRWSWDNTQLYQFALEGQNVSLDASAVVKGRVLNQFSMDQYKDYFRLATHVDQDWETGLPADNLVYVLDKDLKVTGAVKGLGKGEDLKSARFMGDKAYLVTFRSIDPLYVLNLADPKNPRVTGELKIPGYSDYLQPYDENYLIGFGKDVAVQKDGSGAIIEPEFIRWDDMKGFKLSLFDVRDVTQPKEVSSVVLGDRGSDSPVSYNHKALLMSKEKNLLAFPMGIMTKVGTRISKDCTIRNGIESCTNTYTYDDIVPTFNGLMVYAVDTATGFQEKARISHLPVGTDLANIQWEENALKSIQRGLYIGDKLYSVSFGKVTEHSLSTLQELRSLQLSQ